MIPFNKPYLTGNETNYIHQVVASGKISGNGDFTKKCQTFFEGKIGCKKALLTTSCTDALEMSAILCNVMPGDEVIVPSFTFVSTALAFVREGAKIVFADSYSNHPNVDPGRFETLITSKTKVIVVVHYAGVACDMDRIMKIANRHGIIVIEDAAQAIDSYYNGRPLGCFGHMATFSFHETKNIISGEGGMLVINDESFVDRAEIIWEKGTNRAEFFRGEVNKYGWVDTGSSFLPSEIIAAFLWSQLENIELIQNKRKSLWNEYYKKLKPLSEKGYFQLPIVPEYATNNGHMFYILCNNIIERTGLITKAKSNKVGLVFHYLSLHSSPYYKNKHDGRELPHSDKFTNCLVRLPMYYELTKAQIEFICNLIGDYYTNKQ